jgi:protein-tyrosine phosphatase
LLDNGQILTLAGSRYLLLELLDNVIVDISFLITELRKRQISCIVAHPERDSLSISMAKKWFSLGASLQVTASSLLGKGFLGPEVQKPAWRLLEAGLVSVIATDAHDTGHRGPMMKAAYDSISVRLGTAIANLLLIENPARLIKGAEMIAAGTESRPLKADN